MLRSVCTTARALVATPLQPSITKQSSRTLPIARSFYTRSSRRPHIPIQTLQKYHGALQAQLRPGKSSIFIALGSRNVVNTTRDLKAEEKARNRKLEADPEHVSTTSTVTPILGGTDAPAHEGGDVDMLQGIKSDLRTIKETFALKDVPREVFYIGLAGIVPYVVTSFSTLFLAYDINYSNVYGSGYFISGETAQHLLHILEPAQIGYGAVILSFLGAIHWGLEFAEYGGKKYYSRYAMGLIAPAYAWTTTLFPLHSALLSQFMGFTALYFYDTTASSRGFAPPWYATYRFVLTFVVGACIVATLVGRGQIGDFSSHLPGPADRLQAIRESQRMNLEKERMEILRKHQLEERRRGDEEDEAGSDGQATPQESDDEDHETKQNDKSANKGNSQEDDDNGAKSSEEAS